VDDGRVVTGDEDRRVAVAAHQLGKLCLGDAGQHGRAGDLPAVEVQDRQYRTVGHRVEELVGVPARREGSGLGLAVAHDAHDGEVRVVERGAVRVDQGVAELAALVDRPGSLRCHVAGNATREGELAEQCPHPVLVLADGRVDLAVVLSR